MLTPQRIKELVGESNMSDTEAEAIRDELRSQAEILFEQWQIDRIKAKENKNENKQTEQIL
ncbi:MAG: hypothetical protein A2915_00920 [Candidatus Yanofskybacteria bacterium RIFCSPLOWO2_01_FULL_41_34]|uniref:Uncharacterized protein n=1 Tax=Candidatus Yanofskybacteria bacterium RIFCSPHIGHO2_01_FULL_41_26 TaxID=1802661 RepID=A0A1F8EEG5_9BACT|nr:MAG: hypothetical protein A2649_02960 [Candidatus Yanofskybacteria bacterium RIFCSPHIGHO2_01_FULL_41_26]OGN22454.1 MAG: hypothetical protein A2915_00920 [Candidatus Yanofskybacteria bacterium RIFCSPLOWO2_01_FULL_41_34]